MAASGARRGSHEGKNTQLKEEDLNEQEAKVSEVRGKWRSRVGLRGGGDRGEEVPED